jgi:hypothetical protein
VPSAALAGDRGEQRQVAQLVPASVQSPSTVADIQIRGYQHLYQIQPSTWISLGLMVVAVPILWWPTRKTVATAPMLPRPRAEATPAR